MVKMLMSCKLVVTFGNTLSLVTIWPLSKWTPKYSFLFGSSEKGIRLSSLHFIKIRGGTIGILFGDLIRSYYKF